MDRFAAFQHANFRRYFAGQVISSVGTWLQALAVTWLVLDLTGRSDRLGIAVALQFLPLLLLGAPAGVLADRVDNRRLLLLVTSAVLGSTGARVRPGPLRRHDEPRRDLRPDVRVRPGARRRAPCDAGTAVPVGRPRGAAQCRRGQQHHRLGVPADRPSARRSDGGAHRCRVVLPAANAVSYLVVLVALASIRRSQLVARPVGPRAGGNLRAAPSHMCGIAPRFGVHSS